ncbi:hypothetical protein Q7P37_004588 [Cladosporium fusiforme]
MLFALGSNGSGQLGLGHDEDLSTPATVSLNSSTQPFPSAIKRLVAGGNHTVVLCNDGTAFASGDNSDGRCATAAQEGAGNFHQIPSLENENRPWDDVAATWSATVLTRGNGAEVWTCGTGDSGELALGEGTRNAKHLTRVHDFPPSGKRVVQLAACMAHAVAVLDDGEVWGWGKWRKGQLGTVSEDSWKPRKVGGLEFSVEKAVCGKDFTCLVGERDSGELAMLGPNGRDRFGLKTQAPVKVPGWGEVHASWGNVFVLEETGKIVAWGRDDHGQLPSPGLPSVTKIAAGSEHCLALTVDGEVLAWGWGEHGNCGEHIDAKGDVKGRWNGLEISGEVVDLFAGCATSFISVRGP